MMIISWAVPHHVVLVCAAAVELRVRLLVTDLALALALALDPYADPIPIPPWIPCPSPSIHSLRRPSPRRRISVSLVSVGCCDRGADLQLACLLVDDLIKSVWRPSLRTPAPSENPLEFAASISNSFSFPISIQVFDGFVGLIGRKRKNTLRRH